MSKIVNTYAWGRKRAVAPVAPLINNVAGIRAALAKGDKIINLDPKGVFTVTSPIYIDIDGVVINGNGAKLTRQTNTTAENFATLIINKSDVVVNNLVIYGCQSANINKTEYFVSHFGIVLYNSMRPIIKDCVFKYFNGAAIMCCSAGTNITYGGFQLGSLDWDFTATNARLTNNVFIENMIGIANTFKFDNGVTTSNQFYKCACGIYDESGSWFHNGNSSNKTNHGFISTNIDLNIAFTHKLAGSINSGNANYFQYVDSVHGSFNGFESTNSITGETTFANFFIILKSTTTQLNMSMLMVKMYCGCQGFGSARKMIPPSFNNIALVNSGMSITNIVAANGSTNRWNIVNVVVSGVSTTNKGGIIIDAANLVKCYAFTPINAFYENVNVVVA